MTATTEPRGGLDLGWDPGEDGWGPAMNANLLRLSRFGFHASVLSMTTAAPPGSPTNGAGYIIPSGASGEWAGKAGQVAVWGGSAWAYAVPRDGWTIHVVDAGLATYEDGVWSQSNAIKPAAIGAEPYAGVPAQTSFWRSTATGVRAWVQLIAADITDLATTLAGYLTKTNPTFTGHLYQDGNQRITADGIGRFEQLIVDTLESDNLPTVTDITGVLRNKYPAEFRTIIAAAAADHNHFSKLVVSASTSLGGVSASAIYIPATDVNLTLDGGVDGQAWDIFSTSGFGLAVPSGTTLYAYNGVDTGPTTRNPGGGRAIRIVRLTATTWLAPNLRW